MLKLALKPKNLSMREAAAIPLVALTAWEGLVDKANVNLSMDESVQIAKALIYATASTGKQELLEALGATPIDYHTVSPTWSIHPRRMISFTTLSVALYMGIIAHYGHSRTFWHRRHYALQHCQRFLCYTHNSAEIMVTFCGKLRRLLKLDKLSHYSIRYHGNGCT